jgi:ERCC4-related helicase
MEVMTFNSQGLIGKQPESAIIVRDSLRNNGLSFDGSRTGTGKTYVAASVLRDIVRDNPNQKFVVVCPKLAIPDWEAVLKSYGVKAEFIINYEKLCRGNTPYLKRVSERIYRQVHRVPDTVREIPHFMLQIVSFPKDWIVILDESHKCKGVESHQAGFLIALVKQGYRIHMMSATQATTPLDMRAFGYALGLHDTTMKDFKRFCEEAGAEYVGKWGAMFFDSDNEESVEKLKKVHRYIFEEKKIGTRLTREDFKGIFPEIQIDVKAYDMGEASNKIQGAYDEMFFELAKLEERTAKYKKHILAIITKARRKAELFKVPTMVEMAADLYQEGKSVIIFVNYADTIEALNIRLGKEFDPKLIGQIHGGMTFPQKRWDMNEFNADRKRFMNVNLAAGGTAINLHDLIGDYARASLLNPSYSAINTVQACGRTDRAHAKTDVYLRFLLAARTIEVEVARKCQVKQDFIELLNDGDLIPSDRIYQFAHGMDL